MSELRRIWSALLLMLLKQAVVMQVILMSATLDSHLFANYFGDAPALAAGGRTFPVEHFFLEDAHDLIGYHLDAESNCAVRPNRDARSRKQLEAGAGGRDRQGLLRVHPICSCCCFMHCTGSPRPPWRHMHLCTMKMCFPAACMMQCCLTKYDLINVVYLELHARAGNHVTLPLMVQSHLDVSSTGLEDCTLEMFCSIQ